MDDTQSPKMMMGTEILVQALVDEGVEVLFGYPGGAVLDIYDQFHKNETNHILARHEQGAAHAADGYARATGKPGVVVATSGPGATNTVTAIATAMMDSIPMVVITGQVAAAGIGKDAFQEVDVQGIMTSISKYVFQVRSASEIQQTVKEAFYVANTGRKGPVVIDIPKNVGRDVAELLPYHLVQMYLPGYKPEYIVDKDINVSTLMAALQNAQRPLLLWGHGVNLDEADHLLTQFINKYKIPAISTLLGLGAYPADGEYNLGMVGMHGTYAANMAVMECDLLINVGCRFDDRVVSDPSNFAPHAKIAHFDIDKSELGKVVATDFEYQTNASNALKAMIDYDLTGYEAPQEWLDHVFENRRKHPLHYEEKDTIRPERLIEYVGKVTKGEAIVVTDVGQHQMWAAQYYPFKFGHQLLTSGGAGTMGFGVPAAMGASVASGDRDVVCFVGDGGFQMTNQELNLFEPEGINAKIFLINNSVLGMVHQWQDIFYEKRFSHSEFHGIEPDYVKLSEALGVTAARVSDPAELEAAVDKAMAHDGPYVLEVKISSDDLVSPMVAAGESNDKMRGVYTCTD